MYELKTPLANEEIISTNKLKYSKQLHGLFDFKYLIPPLIVAILLLVVYFIKGIYPFGNLTMVYGDMDQHYIPFSNHIYDVFYNSKSLFWDPFLGTGSDIFGIEALSGMFSPISWLVIFTSRENISNFASYLLLIRMALLSLTSFIFMNKMFKGTSAFWRVSLSVMYAFSGYVLIFYTNMVWIDCAILFPLLLLTLKNLFDRNKLVGYVCVLSTYLIISYYVSFMILLFVFFSSGVILYFYIEKDRRKNVIVNLGIGTISSLLFTSFVTIPAFIQSTSSIRFGGFSYINVIGTDAGSSVTLNKTVFFFFAAISLVVFFKMLLNFRANKKAMKIFLLLIFLTVSQVIVEAINMLWYGGSYVCYPLRFGFIPIYLLLSGSAYYFSPDFIKRKKESIIEKTSDSGKNGSQMIATSENADKVSLPATVETTDTESVSGPTETIDTENALSSVDAIEPEIRRVEPSGFKQKIRHVLLTTIFSITALAAFLYALYLELTFGKDINDTLHGFWGISEKTSLLFILAAILLCIVFWILLKFKENKLKYVLLSLVIISEILTHSIWYIGVPPRTNHLDDWSFVANELKEDFNIDNNSISRYKDADSVLNANYPLVLGAPALSSYLHVIEARQQNSFKKMGYSTNYTRLLDTGGTLFSDMVLNVNNFFTSKPYDSEMFELIGESNDFYLCRNQFVLPVGIMFSNLSNGLESTDTFDLKNNTSPLKNQNFMYQTLFNKKDDIIEIIDDAPILTNVKITQEDERLNCVLEKSNEIGILEYNISITGKNYIYLGAENISNSVEIMVNDMEVPVPTLGNISNTSFPASFNNGILNLGLFEDENVKIEILLNRNVDFYSSAIGILPIEKLKAISNEYISHDNYSTKFTKGSGISYSTNNNVNIEGNKIHIKEIANSEGQSLFLPYNYDQGWKCKINGKSSPVNKIFGTFIMLDLTKGENDIELLFIPKGFETGLLLSGTTLLIWLLALFISKRRKISNNFLNLKFRTVFEKIGKGTVNILHIAFWSVYSAALLFVYIIPILSFIIRNIKLLFIK